MRGIRRAAVVLGTAALAVAASAAATVAAAPAPARVLAAGCQPWNGIQPKSPYLNAVAMTSCGAWAVGSTADQQTFVEHWNGPDWTPQATPAHPRASSLSGVAATSPRNAWAVGYSSGPGRTSTTFRTLVLHWDGSAWTQVPSPQGNPTRFNELTGVAATSATNAWAVGTYYSGTAHQTLILHWNGRTWKRQHSPNRPGARAGHPADVLYGVTATSARNAWAVGFYRPDGNTSTLILHWNGRAWRWVTSPNLPAGANMLSAVAAASARSAWAVGNGIVMHWNGTTWQL